MPVDRQLHTLHVVLHVNHDAIVLAHLDGRSGDHTVHREDTALDTIGQYALTVAPDGVGSVRCAYLASAVEHWKDEDELWELPIDVTLLGLSKGKYLRSQYGVVLNGEVVVANPWRLALAARARTLIRGRETGIAPKFGRRAGAEVEMAKRRPRVRVGDRRKATVEGGRRRHGR